MPELREIMDDVLIGSCSLVSRRIHGSSLIVCHLCYVLLPGVEGLDAGDVSMSWVSSSSCEWSYERRTSSGYSPSTYLPDVALETDVVTECTFEAQ